MSSGPGALYPHAVPRTRANGPAACLRSIAADRRAGPEDKPAEAVRQTTAHGWRGGLLTLAVVAVWAGYWYWDTAAAMVSTWRASDTYAHGLLVVPVCAWLVWRARAALASVQPRWDLAAVPLIALSGFGWFLGELAGARVVQQFALVAMVPLTVWTLLGRKAIRTLAFPLAFLFFAVPAGDFLIPWLMETTAWFTDFALRASGVPVYREGFLLSVPTGNWSIAEACSGLRYLIACVTGGVLYAYLRYRRLGRRLAFVAAAVAVPIVANWLRAYLIVMIAEATDGKIAADVDHLVYGWLFFCIVMLLLFGIGSLWSEAPQHQDAAAARRRPAWPARRPSSPARWIAPGLAATLAIGLWPAVARQLDSPAPASPPVLAAPEAAAWYGQEERPGHWQPRFSAPATVTRSYTRSGQRVGLHVAYFHGAGQGTDVASSVNRLLTPNDGWALAAEDTRSVPVGDDALTVIASEIHGPAGRYLVWRWYWIGGKRTASPYMAKLLQLASRLTGGRDGGAIVTLYAAIDEERPGAARVLGEFAAAALPDITRVLNDADAQR